MMNNKSNPIKEEVNMMINKENNRKKMIEI